MSGDTVLVLAVALPPDAFAVVALAATWVLVAIGLHLTFGLLGVVNLAHGEFLLVGAYVALVVHGATGSIVLGLLLAGPAASLVGAVLEVVVLRRLHDRLLDTLLATFGAAVVLRQGIQLLVGPNLRTLLDPIGRSVDVGGMVVPGWRLLIVIATVLIVIVLARVLGMMDVGVRWRAAAGNARLATTLALDVARTRTVMFATGCGLAGVAGALVAPVSTLSPQFGTRFLVPAFLVVILGGVGSLRGLVSAGIVLGGSLALLQFVVDGVTAQMLVVLLAIVLLRARGPWRALRTVRPSRSATGLP